MESFRVRKVVPFVVAATLAFGPTASSVRNSKHGHYQSKHPLVFLLGKSDDFEKRLTQRELQKKHARCVGRAKPRQFYRLRFLRISRM